MAYRLLKITSTLYRFWAQVRMKNLEAWIEDWFDEAMYSGDQVQAWRMHGTEHN